MSLTALCPAGWWKSFNPEPLIILHAWQTLWIYVIQLQNVEDSERHVEAPGTVGRRSWGKDMRSKDLMTGCWYSEGSIKVAEDGCSELPDHNLLYGVIQDLMVSRDLTLNVRRGFSSTQALTVPTARQLCESLGNKWAWQIQLAHFDILDKGKPQSLSIILVYFGEFSMQFSNGPCLYT